MCRRKGADLCIFLSRNGHRGFCEVTGRPTNCGVDFGVEVPCVYRFYATLTDLSSYFSEISVVVLGSVDLYVKYYLCIFVHSRNMHYTGDCLTGAMMRIVVLRLF